MTIAKSMAQAFHNYIMSLPDDSPHQLLLTHAPKGVLEPIVDLAPYSKNQAFRCADYASILYGILACTLSLCYPVALLMLFSHGRVGSNFLPVFLFLRRLLHHCKYRDPSTQLKPLFDSSPRIGPHLIGVYDPVKSVMHSSGSLLMPPPVTLTPPSPLQVPTVACQPRARASLTRIPKSILSRSPGLQSTPSVIRPSWAPGHVCLSLDEDGIVETQLKSDKGLLSYLGIDSLEFRSKTLLDSNICSFTIHER